MRRLREKLSTKSDPDDRQAESKAVLDVPLRELHALHGLLPAESDRSPSAIRHHLLFFHFNAFSEYTERLVRRMVSTNSGTI